MGAVVGDEIEGIADDGEVGGSDAAALGVDVGEHGGAGGGTIALPELGSIGAIVGGEVEDAVHHHGR